MDLDHEPTDEPDIEPTPVTPSRSARTMSLRTVIGAGIGAAAIAAAAVVGVHTLASGPSTAAAAAATNRGPGGSMLPNGGPGGGMPGAFGTIASISGDTFTVTDPMRGATTTVHTTSATVVHTTAATTGSVSDLKVGDRVHVDGTTASDGSLSATEVDSGVGGPGMGGQPPQGQMGQAPQGQMGQPPQGQPQP